MAGSVKWEIWPYTPSAAGGTIGCIVFALLTGFHAYRLFRNRTWFCIPFVIGGLFEAIGYAGRAAAHSDTVSKTPYIIQSVLILIAPILFAASIYMILGRLITRTDSASLSLIRPSRVTKIFVAGDVLCFFVQSGGAGMLVKANDDSDVKLGEDVILAGLILQILIFLFFVAVAGVWHRRLEAYQMTSGIGRAGEIPWQKYIRLLYAASACITVRNTCRVIEYAMGREGYLLTHEWPLYLYDFLPMVIVMGTCAVWYDPNIKPGKEAREDVEIGMHHHQVRAK